MIAKAVIRISTSTQSSISLRVIDVDFELRVYQDGVEVFDAHAGGPATEYRLDPAAIYVVRYNNNDGGAGALHFQVLEARTERLLRYEVNLSSISSPQVMEIELTLRKDPAVIPPA